MKYLVFLLWIPAFLLLYLSIHHEIYLQGGIAVRGRRKCLPNCGIAIEALYSWGLGARCGQEEALRQSSAIMRRSTGLPLTM